VLMRKALLLKLLRHRAHLARENVAPWRICSPAALPDEAKDASQVSGVSREEASCLLVPELRFIGK
jgi:hypothetical protein